jgi:hypothetical protein
MAKPRKFSPKFKAKIALAARSLLRPSNRADSSPMLFCRLRRYTSCTMPTNRTLRPATLLLVVTICVCSTDCLRSTQK